MHRGVVVDLGLRPGLANDGFVAEALGNLAAFELAAQRKEQLQWQVLRVEATGKHHFRLIVRHPERALDLGFAHGLEAILHDLSRKDVDELRVMFARAQHEGLKPVPLRHVREVSDFWQDDFWNWIG